MATIIKNNLKNGISYRIIVRLNQSGLNKAIVKSMTWKKPYDMMDNEAKHYIHKIAYEFEEKIMNELNGKGVKDTDISLIDYGLERLERMKNDISPHSYKDIRRDAQILWKNQIKRYFASTNSIIFRQKAKARNCYRKG